MATSKHENRAKIISFQEEHVQNRLMLSATLFFSGEFTWRW